MMTRSAVRGACGFGVGGVGGLFLTASWFQWSGPWSGPSFAVDVAALLLGYFLSGAIGGSSLGMGRRVSVGFGLGFAVLGLAVPFMTLALIGIQAEGTGAFWHVVVIAMTFAGAFAVAGGIGAAFIRQESSLAWTGAIGFGVGGAVGGGIIAAGLGLQLSRVIPHTDYWMLTGIFGLGWLIAYGIGGAVLGSALDKRREHPGALRRHDRPPSLGTLASKRVTVDVAVALLALMAVVGGYFFNHLREARRYYAGYPEACKGGYRVLQSLDDALKEPQEVCGLKLQTTLTQFPAAILNFPNLVELRMYGNNLGSLPPEVGTLTNLRVLSVGINRLTTIPLEIGNLHQLVALHLHNNKLASIPPEIGNLQNLQYLALDNNQLREIPKEIGQLKKLERLVLRRNILVNLPPEIGNLTKLESLDLSFNKLREVPAEIGKLENLEVLNLDGNEVSRLPAEIAQLKKLRRLHGNFRPEEKERIKKLVPKTEIL